MTSADSPQVLRIAAPGAAPTFTVDLEPLAGVPADGEVRVHPLAVEVAPLDAQIASGAFPGPIDWPHRPCGTAVAVTEDGTPVAVYAGPFGRGLTGAGLAASAVDVPEQAIVPMPPTLDPLVAATGLLSGVTARLALVELGRLRKGEAVLVVGATGGVGRAACQLAAALGAGRVVAASRSGEPVDGADGSVRSSDLAGHPPGVFDVIVDCIGGDGINATITTGALRCRHVLVGYAAGAAPAVRLPLLLLREHALFGLNAFALGADRVAAVVGGTLDDLAAGRIRPAAPATHPLTPVGATAAWTAVGGPSRSLLLPQGRSGTPTRGRGDR